MACTNSVCIFFLWYNTLLKTLISQDRHKRHTTDDEVTALYPGGGGGTRGVRHTGMCRSNRSLFWEKSLNIGYGFELENP